MIGELTLAQIGVAVALVAGIITGSTIIYKFIGKHVLKIITQVVSDSIDPLRIQVSRIEDKINENDIERCKADLMIYITEYNRQKRLTDVQLHHMLATYHHYKYDLHANSYIKNEMERILRKENDRWQDILDRQK